HKAYGKLRRRAAVSILKPMLIDLGTSRALKKRAAASDTEQGIMTKLISSDRLQGAVTAVRRG
ncbi:MAG: hypothetical protein AAFZ49_15085, partial [Cyanobacteria bacterium J06659_2]